jgi:hypothetical protein
MLLVLILANIEEASQPAKQNRELNELTGKKKMQIQIYSSTKNSQEQ